MTTEAASQLTLMAVHAHPDDESTSTGGILAHYALRGGKDGCRHVYGWQTR